MPCYVNIGAYIDEGTMMDTFSRAGSCCQIGKNCHISAGSGIDGGAIIDQAEVPILPDDTVESLTKRIQRSEYSLLPHVIDNYDFRRKVG